MEKNRVRLAKCRKGKAETRKDTGRLKSSYGRIYVFMDKRVSKRVWETVALHGLSYQIQNKSWSSTAAMPPLLFSNNPAPWLGFFSVLV